MRRRWLFGGLLAGVLAIGITGGTVLALGGGEKAAHESFVSRVAAILSLDEAQVQEAFSQATDEIRDEAQQTRLDSLVEIGRLTREQADEYMEWYQARPEVLPRQGRFGPFGGHGRMMRRGHGSHGGKWWKGFEPAATFEDSGAASS